MAAKTTTLNPRTTSYEFLGPPGAFLVSTCVPLITYVLYYTCSEEAGGCNPSVSSLIPQFLNAVSDLNFWKGLWDNKAAAIYSAWYAFCILTWAILPGDWIDGLEMRNGQRKQYKINAFPTFLLSMGIAAGIIFRFGAGSFTFLYERWVGFATASLAMSVAQAVLVYLFSFQNGKLLALGGNSGNILYDWFIGRELNPSIGSFDIKSFNELRPGLILWALIDISMACEQAVRNGGHVTDSMWLVLAFQIWYVADACYNEPAIFSTMDIVTDGFGFMLSVGDLSWVPFVYSLQARYLAFHPIELGPMRTLAIVGVNLLGYYIFRSANGEKNDFRNGKNPKNLQYMTTERGTKLLTSGWWGRSRHPNYMGDLLMSLAWCLPTGFDTPIPYFYTVYFAILLVHRQLRDDEQCENKYGLYWHKYKELVPWRIIPFIY